MLAAIFIGGIWGLTDGGNIGCPTEGATGGGGDGVGKRWKGALVGGPNEGAGLTVCMGLKPGTSGPVTGPGGKG